MKKNFKKILFRGTIAVSIANASAQFVGLLLLPLFTKYLSPEDFGIISMVSLIVTVLALIYNPGIMSATMRLYHSTESENERKLLIGSTHRFFLFVPIIPIILCLIFGENLFSFLFKDFDFYPYGFLALLLAFFIQPSRMWTTMMTLLYKIEKTAFLTALSVLLGLISAVILVVVFNLGAMGRVLAMFVPALFLYFISLYTVNKYTQGNWSFDSIKKQLIFGMPLIIGLWAYQGLNFIGKYFLEILSNLENVGLYTVGTTLASAPLFLVLGFKQLWSPIFYENMNNKDYEIISKLITYFTVIISLLCLILTLFSKEIIISLLDKEFHLIIPIISFLLLATFFNGLLTISNTFLSFNNDFSKISFFALIATISNIILNVLLIPYYGILGASISLMLSYFIYYLLGAYSERKLIFQVQNKKSTFIPPILLVVGLVFNLSLNKYINFNDISLFEIILKLSYFLIVCFIFLKIKLINYGDFKNLYNRLINKKSI